jgi:hypothetical protein
MLYSAMLAGRFLAISPYRTANSLRLRTYKMPLRQPFYNHQLQALQKSVHSTRLTTPLESALTRRSEPNPFIGNTYRKPRGVGRLLLTSAIHPSAAALSCFTSRALLFNARNPFSLFAPLCRPNSFISNTYKKQGEGVTIVRLHGSFLATPSVPLRSHLRGATMAFGATSHALRETSPLLPVSKKVSGHRVRFRPDAVPGRNCKSCLGPSF